MKLSNRVQLAAAAVVFLIWLVGYALWCVYVDPSEGRRIANLLQAIVDFVS